MPETTPLGDAVPEPGDDATSAEAAAAAAADAALEERERTEADESPRLRDMRRARDRPPS